jgi:hypothetical protein
VRGRRRLAFEEVGEECLDVFSLDRADRTRHTPVGEERVELLGPDVEYFAMVRGLTRPAASERRHEASRVGIESGVR